MQKFLSGDVVILETMGAEASQSVYLSGFKAFFSFLLPGCVISGRLWRASDKIDDLNKGEEQLQATRRSGDKNVGRRRVRRPETVGAPLGTKAGQAGGGSALRGVEKQK